MWMSQNAKIKESSKLSQYEIYNWGIPAFRSQNGTQTCPNAKMCVSGCYARSGAYLFGNVKSKYESRLELAQSESFVTELSKELTLIQTKAAKKNKQGLIRIHDSGDFFSIKYATQWFSIINQFPNMRFYSYTKQVMWMKMFLASCAPSNLTLIYSYGGTQDHIIDPNRDRHSKVFESENSLIESGYADTSTNDTVAIGDNHKIGLIYHGNKNYTNTNWNKVSI